MNWYQSQSHYFVIFIVISVMAFSMIPAIKKTFTKTSDDYIISEMKRVQSEMYFYKVKNKSFKYACIGSDVNMLISNVLYELGSGLSCVTTVDMQHVALYTILNSKKVFCVDSNGYNDYVDNVIPRGHCLK